MNVMRRFAADNTILLIKGIRARGGNSRSGKDDDGWWREACRRSIYFYSFEMKFLYIMNIILSLMYAKALPYFFSDLNMTTMSGLSR